MSETDDILLDIATLRVMMEKLGGRDVNDIDGDYAHRAVSIVLASREARLAELDRIAAEQ
jgi:hypothetical protein